MVPRSHSISVTLPESTQKYAAITLRPVRDEPRMTQTDLADMETSYPTLNVEVSPVKPRDAIEFQNKFPWSINNPVMIVSPVWSAAGER